MNWVYVLSPQFDVLLPIGPYFESEDHDCAFLCTMTSQLVVVHKKRNNVNNGFQSIMCWKPRTDLCRPIGKQGENPYPAPTQRLEFNTPHLLYTFAAPTNGDL
jgi:hypothetical protein